MNTDKERLERLRKIYRGHGGACLCDTCFALAIIDAHEVSEEKPQAALTRQSDHFATVLIEKDERIAELEDQNNELRKELQQMRARTSRAKELEKGE